MRLRLAFAVSALALAAAVPSLAQDRVRLAVGDRLEAALTAEDPTADGYRFDDYAIRVEAGQRLEAVLRSSAFDAYLMLFRADDVDGAALAEDDDGLGEGVDSRLRYSFAQGGDYVLRARTLGGLEGGAYSLSLDELAPLTPPPPATPVAVGDRVNGDIASSDPQDDQDRRFDGFVWTARAGDRIAVSLNSDAFDPVLRIGRANGAAFEELAMNDDGGGDRGLNSHLVFTAPSAGDYTLRAMPLNAADSGAYTLSLQAGPPPLSVEPIRIGETVRGELSADNATNDDGLRANAYRFRGRAGQRIAVAMTSSDFDTYLELSRDRDGSLDSLAEDDDGAGTGTDSRLTYELDEDGDYVIQARAFSDGSGAYSLTLSEIAPEPAPTPLAFGRTIQGEIAAADPLDDQGRPFDAYVFTGAAGQRVQMVMRSGDLDSYLQIGRAEGDFIALASDDDGLGEGVDSGLTWTLPDAGDYVVRASPLGAEGKGLYSLELIDRGPQPLPGSLLIGATARGELDEADGIAADGAFFDLYRLHAKAGDKLLITMVSNAFDAYVEVGREGGDFEAVAGDDDSLSDTHARLEWTVPEEGWFLIRARAFGPGQTGPYALTVERKP